MSESNFLCSYIHFLNIPIAFFIYGSVQAETVAIIALSASSFVYHQNVYTTSSSNSALLAIDVTCIHLRSYVSLRTNYYYSAYFLPSTCFSSVVHLYFWKRGMENISKKGKLFLDYHALCLTLPILVDTSLFILNSEYVTSLILVNLALLSVVLYNPFERMNHVALHVLLLVQTYLACWSNANKMLNYS